MQISPLPHCTCYKCAPKEILGYFKSVPSSKIQVMHQINVSEIISSMDLVYSQYKKNKVIIWTPLGKDYIVLVANCTDQYVGCAYTLSHKQNIMVTGYGAYDLSDGVEPYVDFYRYGGNLPDRYVRVMREHKKWLFYESGEPLSFEHVECYSTRLKKERLTKDMVVEYMRLSGYDIMSPLFFQASECVILEGI